MTVVQLHSKKWGKIIYENILNFEENNDNLLMHGYAMQESTHDRVVVSRTYKTGLPEYIGREVRNMTAFEIISIFIGILTLLATFGSLIVAFLAFLDKRNSKKK